MYPFRRFLLCLMLLSVLLLNRLSLAENENSVSVIYLIPSDQKADMSKVDKFNDVVLEIQNFYAGEMDRHGFGRKSFKVSGDVRVHEGDHTLHGYLSHDHTVWFEFSRLFLSDNSIDLIFMEGSEDIGGNRAAGIMSLSWDEGGLPGDDYWYHLLWIGGDREADLAPVVAHELGHAFGLGHTSDLFTDGSKRSVMWHVTTPNRVLEKYAISLNEAKKLDESPFISVLAAPPVMVGESDADVNDDGYIDLYDVLIVRSGMNRPVKYHTDVNNDGITDENDLAIVKLKAVEAIIAASPPKPKFKLATTWAEIKRR